MPGSLHEFGPWDDRFTPLPGESGPDTLLVFRSITNIEEMSSRIYIYNMIYYMYILDDISSILYIYMCVCVHYTIYISFFL